ncbi:hypothetical protein Q7P37_001451 [Cladosporium fusiforme]
MSVEPKPLPFVYQFAAGAVAGVSEILVMYPLDVVKTRVQIQGKVPVPGVDHYSGMLDCIKKIVKNEGASRLYRGISAPIMMEAPKRATKFAANDEWGKVYRNLFGVTKMTQGLSVLTGASAGATESFVVVPFELVKIRLQDKAQAAQYSGPLDVVRKIVKAEGPLALYQGLESTMWRHILWNAGYFGCIFQVRELLPKNPTGDKSIQIRNDLVSGAIGGTVGTILNTPMDVVKSRIQNTTKVPGVTPKYNWAFPALGTVLKEEGFGALYKGFIPKVLRLGPGGGILLVVFTGVMDFFREMKGFGSPNDSSNSDTDDEDGPERDGKSRTRGASDSTVRHLGEATSDVANPLEKVLGYNVEILERLLSPGRWCEKKKFEVCLDGVTFVGLPIYAKENGTWVTRDEDHAELQKHVADPAIHPALRKTDSVDALEVDSQQQSPDKELASGVSGITITAPETPAPHLTADYSHVSESFDSHGVASLGTSMNSASTTAGATAEQMTMFHVVFALSGNTGEGTIQTVDLYEHIAKKLSKALKYCQKRSNYVSVESRKLLAMKQRARAEKTDPATLWTQFLSHSELAWALQEVYSRISADEIAGVRLDGLEMSLQIPPKQKSNELEVTPLSALLLLDDRENLITALDDHRDASLLSYFIRESTPTKPLAKQATKLGIPEKTLLFLAQHLVKWRKARPIVPLHPRNIYIVHPQAPLENLRALGEAYGKRFPSLPSLENMLAMLGGRPVKYGALIQSRDHRHPYMGILAWLVRHELVAPMRTVGWLKMVEGAGDDAHETETDQADLRPMQVSRLLGVRSNTSDDGSSVASDQTAFPTGVPQSQAATSAPDSNTKEAPGHEDSREECLGIIANPLDPSPAEKAVMRSIEASLDDLELRERFNSLVRYFDGSHAFEEIAGREGLKRAKVEDWIGEMEKAGWIKSVRCI